MKPDASRCPACAWYNNSAPADSPYVRWCTRFNMSALRPKTQAVCSRESAFEPKAKPRPARNRGGGRQEPMPLRQPSQLVA